MKKTIEQLKVMDVLESRYGVEKFDEWLDSPTEDFKIFA